MVAWPWHPAIFNIFTAYQMTSERSETYNKAFNLSHVLCGKEISFTAFGKDECGQQRVD